MFAIIYLLLPFSWEAALVLGLPLGLSSTAQVLPLLQSRGRLKDRLWREKLRHPAVSGHFDRAVADHRCRSVARAGAPEGAHPAGWCSPLYAVLAIGGLILAGRYVLSPLVAAGRPGVGARACSLSLACLRSARVLR
jgi:glutathione-regulated potassium-efflux system protein KefB